MSLRAGRIYEIISVSLVLSHWKVTEVFICLVLSQSIFKEFLPIRTMYRKISKASSEHPTRFI